MEKNQSDDIEQNGRKITDRTENESVEGEETTNNTDTPRTLPKAARSSRTVDGKRYVYDPEEGRFGRWIEKSEQEELEERKRESGNIVEHRCASWMTFRNGLKILFIWACCVALILLVHYVSDN